MLEMSVKYGLLSHEYRMIVTWLPHDYVNVLIPVPFTIYWFARASFHGDVSFYGKQVSLIKLCGTSNNGIG